MYTGLMDKPPFRTKHVFTALLGLLAALPAQAQLDFGSPEISESQITEYAIPFYKVIAAPLGSGRPLPLKRDGWSLGLETMITPIPNREPFENAERSVWPGLRILAGGTFRNAVVGVRGLSWRDPRLGNMATFGTYAGYRVPVGKDWEAALQGGWDHMRFRSTYSYTVPGSILTAGEHVPGNYTLWENSGGATAGIAFRPGNWILMARSGPEITFARLQYLYYPSDGPREAHSTTTLQGWRSEGGIGWRGFRLEGGYYFDPYINLGWSWDWM